MRNAVIACLALVALAACASDKERAAAEAPRPDYLASFAPEAADLLLVEVRDDDPVRAARLVAPDGAAIEAHAIDSERHSRGGGGGGFYPSVGVGVGGGSGGGGVSTGVGIGFPIFGGGGGGGRTEYESVARIRIPDLAAYRANWQSYEVRVTLGEGADAHEVVIPAPEPAAP
jgi:hypothetical protein